MTWKLCRKMDVCLGLLLEMEIGFLSGKSPALKDYCSRFFVGRYDSTRLEDKDYIEH